ncbi:hypothetical protein CKAH01_03498 [Colletotrichum kahawae]|uniref:Uncharacterized protein n=1 Tax=Colletotrichum kahawae TaxID=34407 RepID=A0AAD9YQF1_COLKA|nr:hypothetical protein CKAH01_03498 [Colletotrichum kahawae]
MPAKEDAREEGETQTANSQPPTTSQTRPVDDSKGGVAAQERRRACANPVVHPLLASQEGRVPLFSSKILARFSHLTSLSLSSPARILTPKKDQVTRIACGLGRVAKQSNDKGSINRN